MATVKTQAHCLLAGSSCRCLRLALGAGQFGG